MKVLVNWLPTTSAASADVARTVEREGFWGLGVTDSPRAVELYTTIETCRTATSSLAIGPCVTNPVTRHVSVHIAAMRAAVAGGRGRTFFGIGSGDSAVRAVGLRPGRATDMVACVEALRDDIEPVPTFVAAAGPKALAAAGAVGGLLAGCGQDTDVLRRLGQRAADVADGPVDLWASVRFAVGDDDAEIAALRQALLPRALSAARFNLHEAVGMPHGYQSVLRERFSAYDFTHHGRSGANSNAGLLRDRPDIEEWALDRYAVIGNVDHCAHALQRLASAGLTGVFLSVIFEDVIHNIRRAGEALRLAGLESRRPHPQEIP